MTDETIVHYRVNEPYSDNVIEAYTRDDSHEWRLLDTEGATLYDTARVDGGRGMGYGCPEIALRQALIAVISGFDLDADEPGWLEDRDKPKSVDNIGTTPSM